NLWGMLLAQEGRTTEAIHQYQRALEADPELAQAYNNWALVREEQGRRTEAIDLLQRAADRNPRLAEVRSNLGRLLCDLGRSWSGLHQHRLAIEMKPGNAAFHYNHAVGLQQGERYDEADRAFEMVAM